MQVASFPSQPGKIDGLCRRVAITAAAQGFEVERFDTRGPTVLEKTKFANWSVVMGSKVVPPIQYAGTEPEDACLCELPSVWNPKVAGTRGNPQHEQPLGRHQI
jgi:hypothetical protein